MMNKINLVQMQTLRDMRSALRKAGFQCDTVGPNGYKNHYLAGYLCLAWASNDEDGDRFLMVKEKSEK